MDRSEELAVPGRPARAVAILLAALIVGSATAGCGKDDKVVAGGTDPIPTLTSPQATLANMIIAYQARDSAYTDSVYADGYQGTSTDLSGVPVQYLFTKADEVRHVGQLRLDPNILSVSLDFGSQGTWMRDSPEAGDPPEWAVLHINGARIEILDAGSATTHLVRNNPMDYTFSPTVHASGDTTWKIVRWTEIKN